MTVSVSDYQREIPHLDPKHRCSSNLFAQSFTLFIVCDYMTKYSPNSIFHFTDDNNVVGRISNDGRAYLKVFLNPVSWCQINNLTHNISKTKHLAVDIGSSRVKTTLFSSTV